MRGARAVGGRGARRFSFGGTWEVAATPEAVRQVAVDLERYPEWWPQVIAVAALGPDDARVLCRSALPYTLDLVLHAVSRDLPTIEVAISGDLDGCARWTLAENGTGTIMEFAEDVVATGFLGWSAYVAAPVLRWNHARMMAAGAAGLAARARSR